MSEYDPDKAGAREDLCRYLSACYCEPAPEFAEEGLFASMLQAAERIDPDLADRARNLGKAFEAQDLQTLLVDYTRLFLGPAQPLASPYGSSWLGQAAATDQIEPVQDIGVLYREGGFEIDGSLGELPDHVALELEFLYLLNFNMNQAHRAGKMEDLAAAESLQRRFLGEHLGAWIGPFTAALQTGAQTAFYRELAGFTACLVRLQTGSPTTH